MKKGRLYYRAKELSSLNHKAAYKPIQNETRNALRKPPWSYLNEILVERLD